MIDRAIAVYRIVEGTALAGGGVVAGVERWVDSSVQDRRGDGAGGGARRAGGGADGLLQHGQGAPRAGGRCVSGGTARGRAAARAAAAGGGGGGGGVGVGGACPGERQAGELQIAPLRLERVTGGVYNWEVAPEVAWGV